MTNPSGHGGKRKGSGRKRKWSFQDVLHVGQACETRWRHEVKRTLNANLENFLEDTELPELWKQAELVPVDQRKDWLENEEGGGAHVHDVASEVEEFPDGCIISVSEQPPRGTRTQIIQEVAHALGLTTVQVDNLWQEYRRFERGGDEQT
jgi:hypothetical protein